MHKRLEQMLCVACKGVLDKHRALEKGNVGAVYKSLSAAQLRRGHGGGAGRKVYEALRIALQALRCGRGRGMQGLSGVHDAGYMRICMEPVVLRGRGRR